jgi:hypothetical protein
LEGQTIETSVPFDPQEAAYINKRGDATVTGEAFMKRRDGQVVTCAGEAVYLVPATRFAQERITAIYGSPYGGYRSAVSANYNEGPDEYLEMSKETRCDAEGRFSIEDVADGYYYVTTSVLWQVSDYYYEGGNLADRIEVENGRSVSVILSP